MVSSGPPPNNPYAAPVAVPEPQNEPLPPVGSLLAQAGGILMSQWALLLVVGAAIWVPIEVVLGYCEYIVLADSFWMIPLLALGDIVGHTLHAAIVLTIASQLAGGDHADLRSALATAFWIALPFALTYLLWSLAMVGFLLLILPGLYLMTRLCVMDAVAVIERRFLFRAASRSFELTRGVFWPLLGINLLMMLLAITPWLVYLALVSLQPEADTWVLSAAISVIADLVATYPMICFYLVYRRLSK